MILRSNLAPLKKAVRTSPPYSLQPKMGVRPRMRNFDCFDAVGLALSRVSTSGSWKPRRTSLAFARGAAPSSPGFQVNTHRAVTTRLSSPFSSVVNCHTWFLK